MSSQKHFVYVQTMHADVNLLNYSSPSECFHGVVTSVLDSEAGGGRARSE